MNRYLVAESLEAVLTEQVRIPTTVMWNRLEGRPRRPDFTRALKAEVRDPLWMLTRQWQMGEFIGEDAGSPVSAKVAWRSDPVAEVRGPASGTRPYDQNVPLEAVVEARPVPLTRAGRVFNADLRLAMGRRWKKMLEAAGRGGRAGDYRTKYPFIPPDPVAEADFPVTAHAAAWQTLAAIAGRAIDGGALVLHLSAPGGLASDGLGMVDPEKSEIDTLGVKFLEWARGLYAPSADDLQTWAPRHLDYGVGLSAPKGASPASVAARGYRGGRLDWYDFDAVAPAGAAGTAQPTKVVSFFPATVQFDGMPNTRHWAFEEGATSFGDIKPDTTDISKLLLIEFGLVFANDWFLLPIDLSVGSLTELRGLAVTNVFGERFWIQPAETNAGPTRSWRMFRLANKGGADDRLFLPATTPALLESQPVESVALIRDEVSNMVWGIETVVQLPDGSSKRGRELALELHGKFQASVVAVPRPPSENDAKVQYTLMTSVPEHWIPMIPVHIPGDNREIQLQRAAMPRLLEGTEGLTPKKIPPRTQVMREGLEAVPPVSYYVAEEEVERAGTVVETRWQRCRWRNGRVVTWLGHQRTVGRGEGSSGLAFDTLVPKKPRE
ncbi:MAG TPA: hypothetical protein VND93_14100 [Myxococcales bacterium]|nr:hypothetical protein [Myxococcales bacterium]